MEANKTFSLRQECLAGITTFLAKIYIVFLVPELLIKSGAVQDSERFSLIILCMAVCGLSCLLVGTISRFPYVYGIGIVPTALLTTTIASGVPVGHALGISFFAGAIFLLLTMCGLLARLSNWIPFRMKIAVMIGIGVYLACAAAKNIGVFELFSASESQSSASLASAFALIGLLAAWLFKRSESTSAFALLVGILSAAGTAMIYAHFTGNMELFRSTPGDTWFAIPSFSLPLAPDFLGALQLKYLDDILVVLFVIIVDALAVFTVMASHRNAEFLREGDTKNIVHRKQNLMFSTVGISSMIGPAVGLPCVVPFFETQAGLDSKGRTGWVSVIVAIGFLTSMFFAPIAAGLPGFACSVALFVIGVEISRSSFRLLHQIGYDIPSRIIVVVIVPTMIFGSIGFGVLTCMWVYPLLLLILPPKEEASDRFSLSYAIMAMLSGALLCLA